MLFLDELPKFGQRVLEVLRQLIEDQIVTMPVRDIITNINC